MSRLGRPWRRTRPPADAGDAAVWWATRRRSSPEGFARDHRAFSAWLADERNAAEWARLNRADERAGWFASMPEVREMRRAALAVASRSPATGVHRRWLGGVALAAGVLTAILWWPAFERRVTGVPAEAAPRAQAERSPHRHATGVGEHREVVLDDGSRITLNTASSIEVHYTESRREVRLTGGQALFQVAKDPRRPFVVVAGARSIMAIGTLFDVRVGPGGAVDVTLLEGRIRVDPVQPNGLARWLPALEREYLSPGQRLSAPAVGPTVVTVGDIEQVTAWERGQIIFRNDRLVDAVAAVNRYADVQLGIEDPRIGELKMSGVFSTARSEDFLAALRVFYPIQAQHDRGVVALRWRHSQSQDEDGGSSSPPSVR